MRLVRDVFVSARLAVLWDSAAFASRRWNRGSSRPKRPRLLVRGPVGRVSLMSAPILWIQISLCGHPSSPRGMCVYPAVLLDPFGIANVAVNPEIASRGCAVRGKPVARVIALLRLRWAMVGYLHGCVRRRRASQGATHRVACSRNRSARSALGRIAHAPPPLRTCGRQAPPARV